MGFAEDMTVGAEGQIAILAIVTQSQRMGLTLHFCLKLKLDELQGADQVQAQLIAVDQGTHIYLFAAAGASLLFIYDPIFNAQFAVEFGTIGAYVGMDSFCWSR